MANRPVDPRILGQAKALAFDQPFFHWPLEFPEVFSDGGFDCILSNPPWERVKLQEQEFFARHDNRISAAPNKAVRTKMIRELKDTRPDLYKEYVNALRAAGAASSLMRGSGRYPLTGRGDINTYAVFAELAVMAINSNGRAGIILPTGIATDDTTKHFFGSIVGNGQLVDLIGFENEDFIFPDVHHAFKFCKMTIAGTSAPVSSSRVGFFIRRFSQLHDEQRFFALEKSDFWLLNPNTGNCPIFRTQADAELTKAIYRRVPILWRDGSEEVPESNPWRLMFNRMFDMAGDSHHFRTAHELRADGCRLEGNVFVSPYDRYLPLYEAKMLHQFDHRFSTYEGATEKQLNVGILPQPTEEQKQNPAFVVQPRYWVREEIVESAIPKFPEPLALAVQIEHGESIRRVLLLWVAGFLLQRDNLDAAAETIYRAKRFDLHKMVARGINPENPEDAARDLQEQFPLTEQDAVQILSNLSFAEEIARKLIDRFSARWLMGWRDVSRATDRRTLIASLCPRTAVGDKFLLAYARTSMQLQLSLLTIWNSFVCDYVVRQKSGGTALKYFTMRQVAVLHPTTFHSLCRYDSSVTVLEWVSVRASELCYTAFDLRSADPDRAPWVWDEGRRFEIRCELDAAMFHLYLPAANSGDWCPTDTETQAQLAALRRHFSTPRHAVAFILEQFPITRQNDEKLYGRYRTRDRILEIYDAMMIAQQTSRPYQTSLTPPPGRSV
jgi:hypothetical protein